ncbi:hypothetical protein SB861_54085 [Paraburkholderia sp. SIMBA_049]
MRRNVTTILLAALMALLSAAGCKRAENSSTQGSDTGMSAPAVAASGAATGGASGASQ